MKRLVLTFITLCSVAFPAYAADICKAKVLIKAVSLEDPTHIDSYYKKGMEIEAISQYMYDKATKDYYFCQHGGYCYKRFINIGDKRLEALKLTNCDIGKAYSNDETEIIYEVNVNRGKNTASELRYNDITERLGDFGLFGAGADNAAQYYIRKPNSQCGILVKSALEGNPASQRKLESFPSYCKWKY